MERILNVLNILKNHFLDIEDKLLQRKRKINIRDTFHALGLCQSHNRSINSALVYMQTNNGKKLRKKSSYLRRLDKIDNEIFETNNINDTNIIRIFFIRLTTEASFDRCLVSNATKVLSYCI